MSAKGSCSTVELKQQHMLKILVKSWRPQVKNPSLRAFSIHIFIKSLYFSLKTQNEVTRNKVTENEVTRN